MFRKSFLPDATQTLLLGVCLHRDPVQAKKAWREWKKRIDLDDLGPASFQIMSLVCWRLIELGLADPDLPRIKGLHRYRWTQNQLTARGKLGLLRALHDSTIPTLLLAGGVLANTVYPVPSARGLQDMEIVVRKETVGDAVRHLEKVGWLIEHPDIPRMTEYARGHPFLHSQFGEINLFWKVMESTIAEQQEEFWRASCPFEYESTPTRQLSPADQFVYCCEQGIYHPFAPDLQWLADATFILRSLPATYDWGILVDRARQLLRSPHVAATLDYLGKTFEPDVPSEVIDALARSPITLDARIEFFLAGRPTTKHQDATHRLGKKARRYLNLGPGETRMQLRQDFPRICSVASPPWRAMRAVLKRIWRTD
jgi:hypothetical protein